MRVKRAFRDYLFRTFVHCEALVVKGARVTAFLVKEVYNPR